MVDLPDIPTDLPSRIVFALLRGPVRLAARIGMPLKAVVNLIRLAYYQELRERHPRDRKAVAEKLGISLRTAAALGAQVKAGITLPEEVHGFHRVVRERIDTRPQSRAALLDALDCDPAQLDAVLDHLRDNGWAEERCGVWSVRSAVQSYVGGSLPQKIDGLSRQSEVVSDAAFKAFFGDPASVSTARTWVFHADPDAFVRFRDAAILTLRTDVVELDEHARASASSERMGVTVVFSRMSET